MTIKMRDQVEDTVTGFRGTVIARSEWLNGCVQFAVKARVDKDGKVLESEWVDEHQLKVVEAYKEVPAPVRATGGPMADAPPC